MGTPYGNVGMGETSPKNDKVVFQFKPEKISHTKFPYGVPIVPSYTTFVFIPQERIIIHFFVSLNKLKFVILTFMYLFIHFKHSQIIAIVCCLCKS